MTSTLTWKNRLCGSSSLSQVVLNRAFPQDSIHCTCDMVFIRWMLYVENYIYMYLTQWLTLSDLDLIVYTTGQGLIYNILPSSRQTDVTMPAASSG